MESFEDVCEKFSYDDLGLTWTFFMARSNLLSWLFIELVVGFGAKLINTIN